MSCSTSSCRTLLCVVAMLACLFPIPADAGGFDEEAAWGYLLQQVGFGPRNPGSQGHEDCLNWMLEHLRATADEVEPHTFVLPDPYGGDPLRLTNLIARFQPEAEVRVAFAAHWDTRPRADREIPPAMETPIVGANDGASGVAVLLALADWLAEARPSLGVDLVFFDGEDYGVEGDHANYLLGSQRFAADFPGWRPAALVLLDMVGDKDLRITMEGYSRQYSPALLQVVFNRALALGLDAFEPVAGIPVHDDHVPFLQRGIAAIDLIDMEYEAWHTLADTPEACDPSSLGQVGRLAVALIQEDFALGKGLRR